MIRPIPPLDAPTHELRCLAQHPAARRRGEPADGRNRHNMVIQPFPLACRPVLDARGQPRVVSRWEDVGTPVAATPDAGFGTVHDRRLPVRFGMRCPDRGCRHITIYEIVSLP